MTTDSPRKVAAIIPFSPEVNDDLRSLEWSEPKPRPRPEPLRALTGRLFFFGPAPKGPNLGGNRAERRRRPR